MAACVFTTVIHGAFVLALVAAGWFCFPQPAAAASRFWQLRYVAAGGLALAFLLCVASLVTVDLCTRVDAHRLA